MGCVNTGQLDPVVRNTAESHQGQMSLSAIVLPSRADWRNILKPFAPFSLFVFTKIDTLIASAVILRNTVKNNQSLDLFL